MKTQLTKEQSQHLIELGVIQHHGECTLVRLLEIFPKEIEINNKEATLSMQFIDDGWSCQYDGLVWKGAISYREELIHHIEKN